MKRKKPKKTDIVKRKNWSVYDRCIRFIFSGDVEEFIPLKDYEMALFTKGYVEGHADGRESLKKEIGSLAKYVKLEF